MIFAITFALWNLGFVIWIFFLHGSAFQFLPDQCKLAARLSGDGSILLRPADQVRHHIFYRAIWQVFGNVITRMRQVESNIVAHAQQLGEAYMRVVMR